MYRLSAVSRKKDLDPIRMKCTFNAVICLDQHQSGVIFNQLGIVYKISGSTEMHLKGKQ